MDANRQKDTDKSKRGYIHIQAVERSSSGCLLAKEIYCGIEDTDKHEIGLMGVH